MRPLSPDGRWRWDGERWLPTARPLTGRAIATESTAIGQLAKAAEPTDTAEPAEKPEPPETAQRIETPDRTETADRTEATQTVESTEAAATTKAASEAVQEQELVKLDALTIVAPAPVRPAPLLSLDRPAWLDGDVDMPWLARPSLPAQPQEARPRFSARRWIAELRRRLSLRDVGLWPLIAGILAFLALLLLVLVVGAMLWQRLHA